jgi:hypothetical protein
MTYNRNLHDWCGLRLLPNILLGHIPIVALIILIFLKMMALPPTSILKHYFVLVSVVVSVVAELFVHFLLRNIGTDRGAGILPSLLDLAVARKIARKKTAVVDQLEHDPDTHKVLTNAIYTSPALAARRKKTLLKSLGQTPSRDQIFEVLTGVGLAHLKGFVPRR